MIYSEIRNIIDTNYRGQSQMSAYLYSQGYIDGLKKFNVICDGDWEELNNYNHELFSHGLDVKFEKFKRTEQDM